MKHNLPAQLSALAVAIAMGAAISAQAQPFAGTTTGSFISPVAGPDNPSPVYGGVGTSTFTFGSPDGTGANSLGFTGVNFSGEPANTLFNIGTLSYFNGTVALGSSVDQITMDVTAAFTSPSGITKDFDFPLNITVTPNTGTDTQNADYVTLPSVSPTTFTVGDVTYTLGLELGKFVGDSRNSGYFDGNTFHVYEGASATAQLEGIITTNLNFTAPDSTSTMMLLGGISSLLAFARRKLS